MADTKVILGVDIGGTGVKAATVNVRSGKLVSERVRLETPQPSTPNAVIETVARLQDTLEWEGPVGCGFPGLVKGGAVRRAPNLDESWIDCDLVSALRDSLRADSVAVGNDADAAGLAEAKFGAGRGVKGTVVMVTLGTGIGTAVLHNGALLPDTELGHVEIMGKDAERVASRSARMRKGWSWKKWGKSVDRYLSHLEYLLGVDLFIIGGGASKKADRFFPYLERVTCEVEAAQMGNLAGIVGAAMLADPGTRAASRLPQPRLATLSL